MSNETQDSHRCEKYKNIILQKAKEYYEKNKEKRKEYGRNRYRNMTQEQKNKLVEYHREWINRQSEDKKNEMKKKAKEYSKNRYDNLVIVVK